MPRSSPMRRSFKGQVFNKRSNGMPKMDAQRIANEVRSRTGFQARVVKGTGSEDAGQWVVYTRG